MIKLFEYALIALFVIMSSTIKFWEHGSGLAFLAGIMLAVFYLIATPKLYESIYTNKSSIYFKILLGIFYSLSICALIVQILLPLYSIILALCIIILNMTISIVLYSTTKKRPIIPLLSRPILIIFISNGFLIFHYLV